MSLTNALTLPSAVVAGVDVNGLGVLRSLAKARLPIIALDTELNKATMATRFGRKVKVKSLSGPVFVDELLKLARELPSKPVLFLTQEDSVATVSAHRDALAQSFRFAMPSAELMQKLLDKASFQKLAEGLNCPIPKSIILSGDAGTAELEGLRFPTIVKPLTKDAAYGRLFAKAYKVSTAAEVVGLWNEMRKVVREVIVQEWIEGGDSDVYFCLQYRAKTAGITSFVGRKLLQWPPLVGGTAICAPAPDVAEQLTALTNQFFSAVGFVGLGSMEFKRDPRDGSFYMVEPTVGRTDYQEEIATLNGTNIPVAAYYGELGLLAPPPGVDVPPRLWRDPVATFRSFQAGAIDPLTDDKKKRQICDAYFRLYDPGPFLYTKFEAIKRRLTKIRTTVGRA